MRSERIGPLPSESLVTRTVANEATNLTRHNYSFCEFVQNKHRFHHKKK